MPDMNDTNTDDQTVGGTPIDSTDDEVELDENGMPKKKEEPVEDTDNEVAPDMGADTGNMPEDTGDADKTM